MRTTKRIGIIGSGIAIAGSGALAALAPPAAAASGDSLYAYATAGPVTVANQAIAPATVTATTPDSPQNSKISSDQIESALKNAGPVGAALDDAFKAANPSGTDVVAVYASTSSAGSSAACAADLVASCANGNSTPFLLKLGLQDVVGSLTGLNLGGVLSGITNLVPYNLVLSITGPSALCQAGLNGSGLAPSVKDAVIQAYVAGSDGNPLGGQKVTLNSGDILGQLGALGLPATGGSSPLGLTVGKGTVQSANGVATATVGALGLTSGSTKVLEIAGAKAVCGPNTSAPPVIPTPTGGGTPAAQASTQAPSPSPSASPTASASTSKTTKKLTGIGTDEGRSSVPAGNSFLALNGLP